MPTVIITFLLKQEDIVEVESNYIFSNITYFFSVFETSSTTIRLKEYLEYTSITALYITVFSRYLDRV